ncbi:Adenylyltransferase and sulfurtransferase MOCS3-1 [Dictyocoela muelleri]|nr:Adenylyltransferase and sulfurtransferase MOCS3-1 [Dictyocoela muelleri]
MSLTEEKLSYDSIKRYKRQIILNEIGVEGQIKINKSKVLIVGLGGLGSPVALYLASSGIGRIGIVDFDKVELSNLHRQIIHNEKNINQYKTKSCAEFLKNLNSTTRIIEYESLKIDIKFLKGSQKGFPGVSQNENIERNQNEFLEESKNLFSDYDLIIDCTDNIDTRYLLNDIARINKKIFICASVLKWEGQVFVFMTDGPCYRCLFPERKTNVLSCNTAGVTGPMCGIIGSIQALEILKVILELDTKSRLILYDGIEIKTNKFNLYSHNQPCMSCNGMFPPEFDKPVACDISENKYSEEIDFIEWDEYLKDNEKYFLIDLRPANLYELIHLKNSINIPMSEFEKHLFVIENSNKIVALLCAKGINAQKAAKICGENGISSVVILNGYEGYKKCIDPDYPL